MHEGLCAFTHMQHMLLRVSVYLRSSNIECVQLLDQCGTVVCCHTFLKALPLPQVQGVCVGGKHHCFYLQAIIGPTLLETLFILEQSWRIFSGDSRDPNVDLLSTILPLPHMAVKDWWKEGGLAVTHLLCSPCLKQDSQYIV
jgi:hypothetical protein